MTPRPPLPVYKASTLSCFRNLGPLDPPPMLEPFPSSEPPAFSFLWVRGPRLASSLRSCFPFGDMLEPAPALQKGTGALIHHGLHWPSDPAPQLPGFQGPLLRQEAGPTSPPCPLGNQATQLSPTIQSPGLSVSKNVFERELQAPQSPSLTPGDICRSVRHSFICSFMRLHSFNPQTFIEWLPCTRHSVRCLNRTQTSPR